jgi:hypothetical protein
MKTGTKNPATVGSLPTVLVVTPSPVTGDGVLVGCGTTRRLNDGRPWSYPRDTPE